MIATLRIWLDKYVGKEYIDERIYIPNTKHKESYINIFGKGILVDDDARVLRNWNFDRIQAINDNKIMIGCIIYFTYIIHLYDYLCNLIIIKEAYYG